MPTFSDIGLAEPSTITNRVGAVSLTRNTTAVQQEILCLGDPDTTNAIAAVVNAAPASTRWGAVVRIASGPSSAVDFQVRPAFSSTNADNPVRAVLSSTGTDNPVSAAQSGTWDIGTLTSCSSLSTGHVTVDTGSVRVVQSSAVDLNVTVAGYSTIATVSTGSVRVHQSTAADLNVTVAGYSTIATVSTGSVRVHQSTAADLLATARINTSSGGAVEGSTTSPAVGVIGLHVRQVFPTRTSTSALITSSASTALYELVSSAAGLKTKVYAYSITSTVTGISTALFLSSNSTGQEKWGLNIGSGSSGVTGANLAVPPPGSLFETETANALVFIASSTGNYRVSIGYFQEA